MSVSRSTYSREVCRRLTDEIAGQCLAVPFRPDRYEEGDILRYECMGVWPEVPFAASFRVLKYAGGGFAGQVYRCAVESVKGDVSHVPGISVGAQVAVKILVPSGSFARRFRNALYAIGFQSPFSPQVNPAACRAGLLWQRLAGMAARHVFGRADSVAEVYATFTDTRLGSCGEVREWVEGRTWRLEPDTRLRLRRSWRTARPEDTGSPEYVAKRRFMFRFAQMLHQMGAFELARQYEWWTMKSQPNVLKRTGSEYSSEAGLCAVDFRAGLVLLPFLPMSPADFILILRGLWRGSVVQFDRFDRNRLTTFVEARRYEIPGGPEIVAAIVDYDRRYRRSMPDIFHQGWRLLADAGLRRDVRAGVMSAHGLILDLDRKFVELMADRPFKFAVFTVAGFVPVFGRLLRRAWGSAAWRNHARMVVVSSEYFRRFSRAVVARCLLRWHRSGRTGESQTLHLLDRPALFWAQRFTLGFLPPTLHRILAEPGYARERILSWLRFMREFYRDAGFRVRWLTEMVEAGHREGSLDAKEREHILSRVGDPHIARYLQSVAVHFATLPVTEIVAVPVGIAVALTIWFSAPPGDRSVGAALGAFGMVIAAFQLTPISPGSICRGLYVVYLMVRERNWRDYMVAAPVAFVKYMGYLAFPLQMAASFPVLSRFMASRWATDAVHWVPIFGERGALLEHVVFDSFYNRPRIFGAWAVARMKGLLDLWLLVGLTCLWYVFVRRGVSPLSHGGINCALAVLTLCVLPRVFFYPVMMKRRGTGKTAVSAGGK